MARLTPLAKGLITVVVLGAVGAGLYANIEKIAPPAEKPKTNVPPVVKLPDDPGVAAPPSSVALGCAEKPEVRFYHWAWNAQAGLILANLGKQAGVGSLMCQKGVNLKLIREDNVDQMQSLLLTFAERLKKGEKNPAAGAHYVSIMGDGSAVFLKAVNDRLKELGSEYQAVVVGSLGYSRGEDKFMGPPAWRKDPQRARGGLVAGVLRDGDWNIALKWLGDNRIPNNPDESSWDPDALNWVAASDYIDAAQKYVSGYCTELKNTKTGQKEKKCVEGAVTWTPGDVTIAEEKGGLVSIVSTREYRSQMPNVIIGIRKWTKDNRPAVEGMLAAAFEAADRIKSDDEELRKAAAFSAAVYAEKDAAYWYKYFRVVETKDKQGMPVELGGSAVNNLADNLHLFGLAEGATNIFAATYTVFGDVVRSQYPKLLPSFYPVDEVLDTSFVKNLSATSAAPKTAPDLAVFTSGQQVKALVSKRAWDIKFATGKADFLPETKKELEAMFRDLVVAGGTLIEIHGHTDAAGSPEKNLQLSEDRAFAVKKWLETKSPTNFPAGRVKVFSHGQTQPLESNATTEGRAKNRRVEILLGT